MESSWKLAAKSMLVDTGIIREEAFVRLHDGSMAAFELVWNLMMDSSFENSGFSSCPTTCIYLFGLLSKYLGISVLFDKIKECWFRFPPSARRKVFYATGHPEVPKSFIIALALKTCRMSGGD